MKQQLPYKHLHTTHDSLTKSIIHKAKRQRYAIQNSLHGGEKTQASNPKEGYLPLLYPRKVASLSEEEEKEKPRNGISTYTGP